MEHVIVLRGRGRTVAEAVHRVWFGLIELLIKHRVRLEDIISIQPGHARIGDVGQATYNIKLHLKTHIW